MFEWVGEVLEQLPLWLSLPIAIIVVLAAWFVIGWFVADLFGKRNDNYRRSKETKHGKK